LLSATEHLVIATGIASLYARSAMTMAAGWKTLTEAFPERFLLGVGVSHAPAVEGFHAQSYDKPYSTMVTYLDAMDRALYFAAAPTNAPRRVLAALGPKMLQLSAQRAMGAHPYFTTPEHTAIARAALGADSLLAPEQMVVLETDPATARATARGAMAMYLGLPNYTNNLLRLGFSEDDIANGGSDRLVDAIVVWGDVEAVRARVAAHHDAGADHVCIQVLPADGTSMPMAQWRELAPALLG
jgi:probable F420-dependent oxidoreductase